MKSLFEQLKGGKDKFSALQTFYRAKNKAGFGLFSTLAGETFPFGWEAAINSGVWNEEGIYGDNFRQTFGLTK